MYWAYIASLLYFLPLHLRPPPLLYPPLLGQEGPPQDTPDDYEGPDAQPEGASGYGDGSIINGNCLWNLRSLNLPSVTTTGKDGKELMVGLRCSRPGCSFERYAVVDRILKGTKPHCTLCKTQHRVSLGEKSKWIVLKLFKYE